MRKSHISAAHLNQTDCVLPQFAPLKLPNKTFRKFLAESFWWVKYLTVRSKSLDFVFFFSIFFFARYWEASRSPCRGNIFSALCCQFSIKKNLAEELLRDLVSPWTSAGRQPISFVWLLNVWMQLRRESRGRGWEWREYWSTTETNCRYVIVEGGSEMFIHMNSADCCQVRFKWSVLSF